MDDSASPILAQDHVKALLRNMLSRARKRIDGRGGPKNPATYTPVYVKGGYANKSEQAKAMAAARARRGLPPTPQGEGGGGVKGLLGRGRVPVGLPSSRRGLRQGPRGRLRDGLRGGL